MYAKIESMDSIFRGLKLDYPKLSDFELLSLAIQIERNQILANGLCVSSKDSNPSGLEAISVALGYDSGSFYPNTITDVLKEIRDKE